MIDFYALILLIIAILQYGYFFPYTGLVYLNAVFTYSNLPISNVPGYDPNAFYANAMEQYNLEWFIFTVSVNYDFLMPFVVFTTYLFVLKGESGFMYALYAYLITDGLNIFLRFIYRIVSYAFCDDYGQLCRSLNPADPTGKFHTHNQLWDIVFWTDFSLLILYFIWVALVWGLKERAKEERINLLRFFLKKEQSMQPYEIEVLLKKGQIVEEQEPMPPKYEETTPLLQTKKGPVLHRPHNEIRSRKENNNNF